METVFAVEIKKTHTTGQGAKNTASCYQMQIAVQLAVCKR